MADPELSQNERRLVTLFRAIWGRAPSDFTKESIEADTSTLVLYRQLMNRGGFSMDLLESVIEEFAEEKYPPTFYKVKHVYNQRSNRVSGPSESDLAERRKCEGCEGSGIIYVVQDMREERNCPVVPPSATGHKFTRPVLNTIPCFCPLGQKLNNKTYQYSEDVLYRLQRCAFYSKVEASKFAGFIRPDPEEVAQLDPRQIAQDAAEASSEEAALPGPEDKEPVNQEEEVPL